MAGAKRSFAERHMLYTLELRGYNLKEINIRMRQAGYRDVPASTFDMNMRNERVLFMVRPELLVKFAEKPVPYGQWPEAWRRNLREYRGNK
jgi:hypothetical protein